MSRVTFTAGKGRRFTTSVRKKSGRLVYVQFDPSIMFGNVGESIYTTSDAEVIEGLKAHPRFGTSFRILREIDDTPKVEEKPQQPKTYADLCKDKENIVEELSVVDAATAQNWCQRTHGTVFKARKADTIKQEAAEKYNTVFPNFN